MNITRARLSFGEFMTARSLYWRMEIQKIYIFFHNNIQKINGLIIVSMKNNLYQSPKGAKSMDMVTNFAAMLKRRYQ